MSKSSFWKQYSWIFYGAGIALVVAIGYFTFFGPKPEPTELENFGYIDDLSFRDVDGNNLNLLDFTNRPTIVFFFGTTCPACMDEVGALEALQRNYAGKLNFIFVDIAEAGDSLEDLRNFIRSHNNPDFTYVYDTTNVLVNAFEVFAFTASAVIDQNGRIVFLDDIPTTYDQFNQVVSQLLDEGSEAN